MKAYLHVTGIGSASAAADVVRLDLRIQCDAAEVSAALADASVRMARVQAAAREHGVARADLRTSGAGVHQRWADGRAEVVGYTAFQSLQVRVRDVGAVGAIVASAASAGGNALGVDAITLDIADREPVARAARDDAFADALGKAEQYAALADRRLGPVLRLTDVPGGIGGGPMPRTMRAASADAAMAVESGEQTVTAQVTVRWAWGDADPTSAARARPETRRARR